MLDNNSFGGYIAPQMVRTDEVENERKYRNQGGCQVGCPCGIVHFSGGRRDQRA